MAHPPLSRGCISALVAGQAMGFPLTLQVMEIKQIGAAATGNNPQRFRLLLNDGYNGHQAMLATQLNDLVNSGTLKNHSVVSITECVRS